MAVGQLRDLVNILLGNWQWLFWSKFKNELVYNVQEILPIDPVHTALLYCSCKLLFCKHHIHHNGKTSNS